MIKNYKLIKYLNADVNNFTSDKGIIIRRKIAKLFKQVLKMGIKEKIIIDNYPKLNKDEPYIFASTHGFSDDIAACLATIDRSAYLLFGSTNQIEYNKMSYAAWANGFIYVNRLNRDTRPEAIPKMERILNSGSSILIFPEGGWNNGDNVFCNRLFAGPYTLAKKTGFKVVPMAPFYEPNSNKIYMNVGEPIDLSNYDKEEALEILRDNLASLVWENVEKHGTQLVRDGSDIRMAIMEQQKNEYLKNKWTVDATDDELTVYENAADKEHSKVIEDIANLVKSYGIMPESYVPGSLAKLGLEDEKYNFKDYMRGKWVEEPIKDRLKSKIKTFHKHN